MRLASPILLTSLGAWTISEAYGAAPVNIFVLSWALVALSLFLGFYGAMKLNTLCQKISVFLLACTFFSIALLLANTGITLLYLFLVLIIALSLLTSSSTLFFEVSRSLEEGDFLSHLLKVEKRSFLKLGLITLITFFLSILVLNASLLSNAGFAADWTAMLFAIVAIAGLALLATTPR